MTYFLRGALLSFGAFFLMYITLSIGVTGAWKLIRYRGAAWGASFLFGLRTLPLVATAFFVVVFVIPSFLYLEPYRTDETVGPLGLLLACGGSGVIALGIVSALYASWKTARFVASCPAARPVQLVESSCASAVEITGTKPMLLVAGVYRPKLLISGQTARLLDNGELQAAIQHELAHVGFHDNLKKLVLRFVRFPFLSGLERSWMQAAEFAADDAVATDESVAIDLASALLKVAGQSSAAPVPDVAMSLVPDTENALRTRVERLLAWHPRADSPTRTPLSALVIFSGLAVLAASYGALLQPVHELSELLIR